MRTRVPVAVVFSFAATAYALTITVPDKLKAKATVIVDELGQVLFGSTPGNVTVTNLPAVQQVQVTNFPPGGGGANEQFVTLADNLELPISNPVGGVALPSIPTTGYRRVNFLLMETFGGTNVSCGFSMQPCDLTVVGSCGGTPIGGSAGGRSGASEIMGPYMNCMVGNQYGGTVTVVARLTN